MTIVCLSSADRLLNYQLDWPARQVIHHDAVSDLELLSLCGMQANQLVGALPYSQQYNSVVIPIHCSHDMNQGVLQWQSDLQQSHYEQLTELLSEFIPGLQTNDSNQYWGLNDMVSEKFSDHLLRDGKFSRRQQEIEMALYRHTVNIEREGRQKKAITGVMIGMCGGQAVLSSRLYTNSSHLRLCGVGQTLEDWLEQSSCNTVLVLGARTGDSQLQIIKEYCLTALTSRRANYIKVIQPNITERYSATVLHRYIAKFFS